jgi:hypothetical protein
MALDYSKLTEEELKAIANNDYSKLSDATLNAIANKPTTTARKEQGKAFVSLADSALNTITGGLDSLAYPLANYYYGTAGKMSPADAAARAQAETTSPKDVFGRAFGYKDQTTYESNPFKQAANYIGEGLTENVITPISQATGMPEQSVGNMLGTGMLGVGAVAPKISVPQPIRRGVNQLKTGSIVLSFKQIYNVHFKELNYISLPTHLSADSKVFVYSKV